MRYQVSIGMVVVNTLMRICGCLCYQLSGWVTVCSVNHAVVSYPEFRCEWVQRDWIIYANSLQSIKQEFKITFTSRGGKTPVRLKLLSVPFLMLRKVLDVFELSDSSLHSSHGVTRDSHPNPSALLVLITHFCIFPDAWDWFVTIQADSYQKNCNVIPWSFCFSKYRHISIELWHFIGFI